MNYITKGIGGFYYVKTPDGIKECKARGIFRKSGIKPVAGDWVELSPDGTVIDEIRSRKNVFVRPPIANLDVLFIVASTVQPVPSLTGRMLEDARNEIKGKFSVRVVEQASEQPAGTVLSQSPAAGSEARITSAITLVVSTGVPEVVKTPTDTGNGDEGDSTIEESWWPSADGTHQIHQLTDGSMWNENGQRCDAQGNPL